MKIYLFCFGLCMGLGSLAHAQLTLDSRYDAMGVSYNDAAKAAGQKGTSAFQGNRLRLLMQGKINEELSAKLRLNLLAANSATTTESGFSKYVDFAYLTHQLSPNFSLLAGKVIALIGGREAIVNPADYYFVSLAGAELLGRDTTALWPVGAILSGSFDNQRIDVLAANTTANDAAGQSRSMVGFSYLGSFADKTILPLLSYHTDATDENNEKRAYMAVGSKFVFGAFDLDVDYLVNQKSYKTWAANAAKDTSSFVASLRYKTSDSLHLILKGESSTEKQSDAVGGASPDFNDLKQTQVGLSAEYYPFAETKFRYHVAAVQKTIKPSAGDDLTETKLLAGVRLVHDFLK